MSQLVSVGEEIKIYRIEAGLSQEDLSRICGVDRAQLSRIEAGEVQGVTFATIERILRSLRRKIEIRSIESEEKLILHPFVKWAGGKTQLLEIIEKHLPKKFDRYFEPFVGGGALLFKLQPADFIINDSNPELISVYRCFANDSLFKALKKHLIEHEKKHSEEYYYKIREMDRNELFEAFPVDVRAARMIYLNKACFNGLYRVNAKGYFNVPSGKKVKVKCFDDENFYRLRSFFKNRKYVVGNDDYSKAVLDAKEGDFVYFDPPYDTLENKDSFTSYSKENFGKSEQIRLSNIFKELSDKKVKVMLSNHNTKLINELYANYNIHIIHAKRMINSKGDGRGEIEEVLITNYE